MKIYDFLDFYGFKFLKKHYVDQRDGRPEILLWQ